MPVVVVVPCRHFCGIWCSTILLNVELVQITVVQGITEKKKSVQIRAVNIRTNFTWRDFGETECTFSWEKNALLFCK